MTTGQSSELVFETKEKVAKELQLTDPTEISTGTTADPELTEQADDVVARFMKVDLTSQTEQDSAKNAIETMGADLQRESARKSAMLQQPLTKLMADSEEGGKVAKSLIDLKIQVEELDPAHVDLESGWFSRMLGYIPGVGTPIKRYFSRYESASTSIDAIINSLEAGREQLKRDNITLIDDQAAMRALTLKLEKSVELGQLIDKKLQDKLDTELASDDPRHKFISEELLFPLRQRIQDLQQQLLVNQQGFLTTEMVIRNNKELMRGVNRALNTTVSALQVGVTLALALANQKIVLDKVQSINKTTENLIAGTAERLKMQGAEIQKQASSTQLDIAVLKKAFADIEIALDDINSYRQKALPQMAKNILEMDEMAKKAEGRIQDVTKASVAAKEFPLEIK